MSRKPPNPKPWYCIACGAELPPERQQGRCLECLIGPRPVTVPDFGQQYSTRGALIRRTTA